MRADRLLAIMLLLQTQGKMTARSLAERLEVSRRTILRDIDALGAAGVPVYAEGGHGGGITLDEGYRTTLAGLQENEIRTLFIGDNAQLLGELGLGCRRTHHAQVARGAARSASGTRRANAPADSY